MTLTITASPPLIKVTDVDGHEVLNTSEKLFYGSDRITGTRSFATRNPPLNQVNTFSVGLCHPSSTFVRGAMQVTGYLAGDAAWGQPTNRWISVGGSYVHACTAAYVHTLHFTASGGTVYLVESLYASAVFLATGQGPLPIYGFDIEFDLIVGGFI